MYVFSWFCWSDVPLSVKFPSLFHVLVRWEPSCLLSCPQRPQQSSLFGRYGPQRSQSIEWLSKPTEPSPILWKPPYLKTFGQPSRSSSSKNFSSAASASSMAPPQSRSSIDSVFVRVFLCIFWQLNHDLHGFTQAQIRKYEALDIIRWF